MEGNDNVSGRGGGGESCCIATWVDDGSVESHRYFLARRTVLEMLRDRGFDIPDSDINISLNEFRSVHGQHPDLERLRISLPIPSNPSKKILVIFCGTDPIRLSSLRGIASQIDKHLVARFIMIVQSNMTPRALKEVNQLLPFKVEIFQITDLLINITKHVLKPKHDILTSEEKEKLLKKYNLEDKQIPRMLESDAIARYYGLEKGQLGRFKVQEASHRCSLEGFCLDTSAKRGFLTSVKRAIATVFGEASDFGARSQSFKGSASGG